MNTFRIVALSLLIGAVGCGSSSEATSDDLTLGIGNSTLITRDDDGNLVSQSDANQDGETDVWKYLDEYPDPNDPSVTKTRLVRKEVDVNFDGRINIIRHYNELGELKLERVDVNLDGIPEYENHLDSGRLVRRDVLDTAGRVVATRYYANGELQRIEKDTNGDSKTDYWEFYEQGILDRIGRDLNGNGRADTWQTR